MMELQRLSELVIQGNYEGVRQLSTANLVKQRDRAGRTALMLVADTPWTPVQTEKCVLYLLYLGASQKAIDKKGDTAAHLAARRDHLRLLALLDFDTKWLQNKHGATPLMEAARIGSLGCTKHLLHLLRQRRFNECELHGNDVRLRMLNLTDKAGNTALDIALQNNHSEIVKNIMREMDLVVDKNGLLSGLPILEIKAREELEELAQTGNSDGLHRATAKSGFSDLPDRLGATILMRESLLGNSKLADLWEKLLQEADPTCADIWSATCLHWAAGTGNCSAVVDLINAGASVNCRGPNASTPLMWAAVHAPPAKAREVGQLLLKAGCNWSRKSWKGQTALSLALENEKSELVELLRGYQGKTFFEEPLDLPAPFRKKWHTVRLIGSGGSGTVEEVVTDTGVTCAAKTIRLPVQSGQEPSTLNSKVTKAIDSESNLFLLKHDNIVSFLHVAQTSPAEVVIFMELLHGPSLERFLEAKPLTEDKIKDFSRQLCSAMQHMHSRQPPVIHRDINCSNIIVLAEGKQIKLVDFGLSIKLNESVSHISSTSQTPKGTLNFMAPELLGSGESEESASVQYSRESDIWAFGCTVYQMATGARPYSSTQNLLQLAHQLANGDSPRLPDGCSEELRQFYGCCTVWDRRKRKSAAQLLGHKFLE